MHIRSDEGDSFTYYNNLIWPNSLIYIHKDNAAVNMLVSVHGGGLCWDLDNTSENFI